jgi:hypothetical protein
MLVRIVVALLDVFDTVLTHFWNGTINSTTPKGVEFAGSVSTILHYGAALVAQILVILVNPFVNTT